MKTDADQPERDAFNALASLLTSAATMVRELGREPHLPRLVQQFLRLPAEDRPTVLSILAREVDARAESVRAGDGLVGPPSRFASIYVRVFDSDRDGVGVTRDEVVSSTIRATVFLQNLPPELAADMDAAVGVAIDMLSEAEARAMDDMYDDVLAVLAAAES